MYCYISRLFIKLQVYIYFPHTGLEQTGGWREPVLGVDWWIVGGALTTQRRTLDPTSAQLLLKSVANHIFNLTKCIFKKSTLYSKSTFLKYYKMYFSGTNWSEEAPAPTSVKGCCKPQPEAPLKSHLKLLKTT